MKKRVFRGSPAEVGSAQGAMDPEAARAYVDFWLARPHDFEDPYFRKNLAFMRREFPDMVEQIEAFAEAAGMPFDHAYYSHVHWTGAGSDACSTLGIVLQEDGPAMLSTNDGHDDTVPGTVDNTVVSFFPDAKPHGMMGLGGQRHVTLGAAVNDSGLLVGANSGHRRFNPVSNPECLNLYFIVHLLAQHCADCGDVRHFVEQYRLSGQKGMILVTVDAAGNILGLELESENIAVSEAQDGMLLEVNHWQHPTLQVPSRRANPDWWNGSYYYNSQARVIYFAHYRGVFARMKSMQELVDFSFDVHAPGRILQMAGRNVDDLISCQVMFASARERMMRIHLHPLGKDEYEEFRYPE